METPYSLRFANEQHLFPHVEPELILIVVAWRCLREDDSYREYIIPGGTLVTVNVRFVSAEFSLPVPAPPTAPHPPLLPER